MLADDHINGDVNGAIAQPTGPDDPCQYILHPRELELVNFSAAQMLWCAIMLDQNCSKTPVKVVEDCARK